MTRLESLKALEAKVEAGEWDAEVFDRCFDEGPAGTRCLAKAVEAFHGSLDAAKALHEAVLPGWSWEVTGDRFGSPRAAVWLPTDAPGRVPIWGMVPGGSGGRAWLLAIIRALISTEEGKP